MSRSSFLIFSILGCLFMLTLQIADFSLSASGFDLTATVEWLLVDAAWFALLTIGLFPSLANR